MLLYESPSLRVSVKFSLRTLTGINLDSIPKPMGLNSLGVYRAGGVISES